MYAYIKGELVAREENYIVVENNGIGYLILIPFLMSAEMGHIGESVTCYVYHSVKEDGISLYGFTSKEQKDMFLMLITVSGIGPKVGQNVCCYLTPEQLTTAVISNDVATISSAKGLGKKTAERITLELRDKIKATEDDMLRSSFAVTLDDLTGEASSARDEAVAALVALGYNSSDAMKAVRKVLAENDSASGDTEMLLKLALKEIF